jgi:hypothetical protein
MNKQRRAEIEKIQAAIFDIKEQLEVIRQEEQDAFDNLPESIQGGERGDRAQEAIDALDEALARLEEADEHLQEAAQ